MRNVSALGVFLGVAAAIVATMAVEERDASACGGCLRPPEVETVITDELMMLSISKDQTTLYDQITYSGSPSSFAWVLPIHGTVTVGLSNGILFQTIDAMTATRVIQPTAYCSSSSYGSSSSSSSSGSSSSSSGGDSGVTVIAKEQVGPYETVQLKSSDGSALFNWLKSHGYSVPAADKAVIDSYVADNFNFLAMKLVPGAGVQDMQPVRITTKGAAPQLPLHMVAVGTGPTTGISIWVVADARWEPKNFPTFTISDSELVWNWNTSSSNYETLRLSKEAALGGKGWQVESSLEMSQYTIRNDLLFNIDYGFSSSSSSSSSSGGSSSSSSGSGPVDSGGGDGGGYDNATATADLAVLFAGISGPNVRVTRMRSDVAHSALSADMFLEAAADQTELTNVHYPAKTVGDPCGYGYSYDGGYYYEGGASSSSGGAGGNNGSGNVVNDGCSTTGTQSGSSRTTLAILLALVSFGAAGIRRRRRSPPGSDR